MKTITQLLYNAIIQNKPSGLYIKVNTDQIVLGFIFIYTTMLSWYGFSEWKILEKNTVSYYSSHLDKNSSQLRVENCIIRNGNVNNTMILNFLY